MSFPDIMEAYALDPTAENLIELHRAIMAAPSYDPMVMIAGSVAPLAKAGEHQAIVDELWRKMPGACLSPTAHMHLSLAYANLGDKQAAQRERKFAMLAMNSIRDGGDGTQEHPFPVLRIEDEYTVIDAVKQQSTGQRQISDDSGHFDVHTLEDGSEMWFRLLWRGGPDGTVR